LDLENGKLENKEAPKQERLTGKTKYLVLAAVAGEFSLYWFLVFYLPKIMLPVSLLFALLSFYFYRSEDMLQMFQEEYRLSSRDLDKLRKYLFAWIFIALYGSLFSICLIIQS